ncbi:zinc finger protein GIS2-like [Brachypodium distachyon]|uniref:zinc finger protein GIS2-like n=1 Tax=Brachypodium distachyon TaxID=15368 RepID=UPI00052FF282|nr:zinc finger protein GIS2-like [Brachypodium distachyon]|eukprot:XP_010236878.1 zinc finger protein GIS2-like [Brachypodium distachyon]
MSFPGGDTRPTIRCDACGKGTHRRNHCVAFPCARCQGTGHYEYFCTTPADFDFAFAAAAGAPKCAVCGGAGHGGENCETAERRELWCGICDKDGHVDKECPTRDGGEGDHCRVWFGYDICPFCRGPDHRTYSDCPRRKLAPLP